MLVINRVKREAVLTKYWGRKRLKMSYDYFYNVSFLCVYFHYFCMCNWS